MSTDPTVKENKCGVNKPAGHSHVADSLADHVFHRFGLSTLLFDRKRRTRELKVIMSFLGCQDEACCKSTPPSHKPRADGLGGSLSAVRLGRPYTAQQPHASKTAVCRCRVLQLLHSLAAFSHFCRLEFHRPDPDAVTPACGQVLGHAT